LVITTKGPEPRIQNQPNLKIIEIKPPNIASLYDILASGRIGFFKQSIWHLFDLWNISSYTKIKKILDKEKPDIIHSNSIQGLSSSVFSAINSQQIPHVHTLHDYELISRWVGLFRKGKPFSSFHLFDRMYLSFSRKISSNINSVISPSRFVMNFHKRLGFFKNSDTYIVPNGYTPDYKSDPKKENNKEFIFMGQIWYHKGPHIAVKAFQQVKDKKARLHIVGRGPYFDALKKIASNDRRIILYGFVEQGKLVHILKRCSYFILPSIWYENFPLVINEAMSKGLPVIASNIGGIPELVKDEFNGFLFEANNIISLRHIIENVINDKYDLTKLSENAILSSRKFPFESQMKSILEIYSKTINKVNR